MQYFDELSAEGKFYKKKQIKSILENFNTNNVNVKLDKKKYKNILY